jgi:hypothetical protein
MGKVHQGTEAADHQSSRVKSDSVVCYVATLPEKNQLPGWLGDFEKDYPGTVVHPFYNWGNEVGKHVASVLGARNKREIPAANHGYLQMMQRDQWALSASDVLIYDLDKQIGDGFLALAGYLGKRVIGISNLLSPPPPYYSGAVGSVIKPVDLLTHLSWLGLMPTWPSVETK